MKRKFLSIIAGACLAITPISATGYPVFDVSGWLTAIDQLYQQIDTVNEKINALRKKASCPNCGFDNDEKAAFCSRCGANLNQEQSASNTEEANDQGSEGDNSI